MLQSVFCHSHPPLPLSDLVKSGVLSQNLFLLPCLMGCQIWAAKLTSQPTLTAHIDTPSRFHFKPESPVGFRPVPPSRLSPLGFISHASVPSFSHTVSSIVDMHLPLMFEGACIILLQHSPPHVSRRFWANHRSWSLI